MVTGTSFCVTAQEVSYTPLQKGDALPSLLLTFSEGENSSSVNLQQFKGKLIIIDFWGVNCLDCIAALPKMAALQHKFKDELKIIVVTSNTDKDVKTLFNKFKSNPNAKVWLDAAAKLPFIKSDSVLCKLFPHIALPTHVWIGPDQQLLSVAYSTSTTEENVRMAINRKEVRFDEPQIFNLNRRDPVSWLDTQSPVIPLLESYSFLTKRIEFGMGKFTEINWQLDSESKKNIGVTVLNKTVIELYKFAYSEKIPQRPYIPANRILITTTHSGLLELQGEEEDYYNWAKDHVFSYALKLKKGSNENIYSQMAYDLDRFFGYKSFVTKMNTLCWVLKTITSTEPFKYVTGKKYYKEGDTLVITDHKMVTLYSKLDDLIRFEKTDLPFIDVTRYTGKIAIAIPWLNKGKMPSINEVNKQLRKFGLALVKEYTDIDILVIADQ